MFITARHRYLVAVLSLTAACAARWAWPDLSRTQLLLGAIAVSSGWGGFGPGLAAVVLAAAVRWLWPGAHAGDVIRHVVFEAEGVVLVIAIAALYQARVHADRLDAAADETRTVTRDVPALRAAPEALSVGEQKYRRLFEESHDAILVAARGAIADANPAAVALLGYEKSELIALKLGDLLVDPNEAAVFGGGSADAREVRTKLRRKDDAIIHVWITPGVAGIDDRGDTIMIRDVTATLSLERQMQQAQKMEAVGRLAGGVAHDFNNLLTAISGYTELLIANLSPADPNIQDAYEIRRAALSAARLTRQLLAFSSHQRTRTEILDVNVIVAQTAGILKRTLGEDISVTLQLDPELKRIEADPAHVEQIILNLAVNARDAMPDGGRLIVKTSMHTVSNALSNLAPGEYVRLAVADTGCGIPEDIQSKVFEPFFTTKGTSGTGLGLATVYGIVKQIAGRIRVDSIEGRGATFTIDLPSTSKTVVTGNTTTEAPHFVEGYATVLVVEDDPRVRELTELVLRRAGYDVVAATGPREALAAISGYEGVNLVVTDVVMPEMSGYDLTEQLRKVVPGLRCVFMSGFACDQSRKSGADPFLAKPFTVESLTAAVRQAMVAA